MKIPLNRYSPAGNVSLVITGTGFGSSMLAGTRIMICDQNNADDCMRIEIVDYSDTEITVTLPAHDAGCVVMKMLLGNLGYADVR